MKTLDIFLSELNEVGRYRGPNYVDDFESVLARIMDLGSDDIVIPLMEFFEEDPTFPELMFAIIHSIESTSRDRYIAQILRGISGLDKRAPSWAAILIVRILNSENDTRELIRQLHECDQTRKDSVRKVMERITAAEGEPLERRTRVIAAAS